MSEEGIFWWHFVSAYTPNWEGFWKSNIKAMKYHSKIKTTASDALNFNKLLNLNIKLIGMEHEGRNWFSVRKMKTYQAKIELEKSLNGLKIW